MKEFGNSEDEEINFCFKCGSDVGPEVHVCPKCNADLTVDIVDCQQELSDYRLYSNDSKLTITRYFCSKCGYEVTPEAKVCPWCGDDKIESVNFPAPAGFWIRVLASLVDGLIFIPIVTLINYNLTSIKSLVLMLILTIPSLIYKPLMEARFGGTVGKMVMRIKVIDFNGMNISLFRAYLRFLPQLLPLIVGLVWNYYLFSSPEFTSAKTSFQLENIRSQLIALKWISNVCNIVALIDVLALIRSRHKRAIHDYLANSYCVHK